MSRLKRIVDARGGVLFDGGRRALIRGPGHGPHDRSVSLQETEDGRLLIHCFSPRDDWRAVRDDLAAEGLLETFAANAEAMRPLPRAVVQPRREERGSRAQRLWIESGAIAGSAAARYLRKRAIEHAPSPALRFHPRMTGLDDRERRPALIAALSNGDGDIAGVQVTLLSAHGGAKAQVATPRRVIGRMLGCAVRLARPDETLVVAEGVETALSAQHALGAPAWALLSAVNLARFEPPASVTRLLIAADNDDAGMAAARALQARVGRAAACAIAPPPPPHKDWNDWLRASRPLD